MNNTMIMGLLALGGLAALMWAGGIPWNRRQNADKVIPAPAPIPAARSVDPGFYDPYTYDYGFGSGTIPGIQGHRRYR